MLSLPFPSAPVRVIGNIPYALTADIIRRIVAAPSVVDAHLVVQREAARKFAGTPWASESLLSLSLKPWWHTEIIRSLRRTDFLPPPRVDSVVLWLSRRSPALVQEAERLAYQRFLRRGFGRAGTTRQAMAALFTRRQVRRLAAELRIELDAPPSGTRFEQWLGLYRFWRLR